MCGMGTVLPVGRGTWLSSSQILCHGVKNMQGQEGNAHPRTILPCWTVTRY